jgi:glycosyl transferase family 2
VVVPCYRQERFLPRTVAALERALEAHEWRGALVLAAPSAASLPPLSRHWSVISPPVTRPLTPGAARMLGFAACGGEWVLFPDADVEVEAAWVDAAIAAATQSPTLAGIGGRLEEWIVEGGRERRGMPDMYRVGERERAVGYLATLAFYRRDALIAAGGYEARLNSEEDFELGLRLTRIGLELRSLGMRAARHWSGPRPSLAELARRWSAGLCFGTGQVLRLYAGRPGFGTLLKRQTLYLATLLMWGLAAAGVAGAIASRNGSLLLAGLLPVATVATMSVRKRSLKLGTLALLSWTQLGLGLVVGLFRLPGGAREARC